MRLFLHRIDVFFSLFMRMLCVLPVLVLLTWASLSCTRSFAAAQTADPPESIQRIARYIDIGDDQLSRKKVVEDDGSVRFLWEYEGQYEFSHTFKPEITIIRKGSPFASPFGAANRGFGVPQERLEIVRLEQDFNMFSFGSEYCYVGKDLTNLKPYEKKIDITAKLMNDQQVLRMWGVKKLGPVQFKTFFSRTSDNVARDPGRPQMLTDEEGIAMDYKLPALPLYLSISHSESQSRGTFEPGGSEAEGSDAQNIDGSLYFYGGDNFDLTLSSSYSTSQDRVESDEETEVFWHEISASFRPTGKITITPTVSFGEYRYLWYGERTESPSASLSVSYSGLFDAVDLSLWSSYSQMRETVGYQDDITIDTWAEIGWDGDLSTIPRVRYALGFGHEKYIDKIYSDSSYDTLSMSFRMTFPF
jgi:hypothetical protein